MGIDWNEISANSNGGTELLCRKLEEVIAPDLLDNFQIIPSRVRELDDTKIRVLWCHDLPEDPESAHLANEGWRRFHRIVFVSHWQMQAYIAKFNIPWDRCQVIQNAIWPITPSDKSASTIRIIYHSTPHRGLQLLVPVFEKLCETHDNIHLDVYSSFKLYGWEDSDKQFAPLFERMDKHDNITAHGTVTNEAVRSALSHADIFAYPCIWTETSCMCLMEAMSAGLICIHPTLGALPETGANWTMMYQWHQDPNKHAQIFYANLNTAIEAFKNKQNASFKNQLASQKGYADVFYNWELRKLQWEGFLTSLLDQPRAIEKPEEMFRYRA